MLIKSKALCEYLRDRGPEGLTIVPLPDLAGFEGTGAASRWFITFRPTRMTRLEVARRGEPLANEAALTKTHYVPFGENLLCFGDHAGVVEVACRPWWLRRWEIFVGSKRFNYRDGREHSSRLFGMPHAGND